MKKLTTLLIVLCLWLASVPAIADTTSDDNDSYSYSQTDGNEDGGSANYNSGSYSQTDRNNSSSAAYSSDGSLSQPYQNDAANAYNASGSYSSTKK